MSRAPSAFAIAAAAGACVLAWTPSPGSAQLRLLPQVGLYAPLSDLPEPSSAVEIGERESSLAYGLGLEFGGENRVSFRANVLHATDSEIPVGEIGCRGGECARSTLTAATFTLALRPLPELVLLRPYFLAGGGVKRYDFERADLEDEGARAVLSDQNVLTGHLGVGLEVDLGILTLAAELSDVVGDFESDRAGGSDLQHDMFFMVGIILGGG